MDSCFAEPWLHSFTRRAISMGLDTGWPGVAYLPEARLAERTLGRDRTAPFLPHHGHQRLCKLDIGHGRPNGPWQPDDERTSFSTGHWRGLHPHPRFLLSKTSAHLPYLDALTTVFGIIATLMMVEYVRANWLYWIGIDLASALLYARRQMWPTVLLYLVYTVMALYAYLNWGG